MNTEELQAISRIQNTPEWKTWVAQGRAWMGATNKPSETQAVYNQLKAEDKNISNYYELATGKTADQSVLDTYSKYASDPALLQAAIGKTVATTKATGTYGDQINTLVKEKLGRDATDAEKEYFGKNMESGDLDAYTLNSFLEGTNEYQTKYVDTARQKLSSELGAADQGYMDKVSKQLEAKYAAQGRPGAGAYGSALIGATKDLASERGSYLSGLGYQSALQGQSALQSNYQNNLNQMYNNKAYDTGLAQESRQRYYSNQDYARQQAEQERLRALTGGKKQSFLQQLTPGLIQAGSTIIGGALSNPQGGAAVGGALKSAYMSNPRLNTTGYYGGY